MDLLPKERRPSKKITKDWLSKFGYLPPPDPVTGQLQTKEALTKAIKAMQRFGGLKETGILDQATLGLMKTPRCSLPDVSEAEVTMGRRKRGLTPPNKWNKRHLSWSVTFDVGSCLCGAAEPQEVRLVYHWHEEGSLPLLSFIVTPLYYTTARFLLVCRQSVLVERKKTSASCRSRDEGGGRD
ncbi:hypothetical protein PAMP_013462 [Pampus punctatissimus]